MKLLLAEDDRMIGESLVRGLGDDGYVVDWVRDGRTADAALADPAAAYALVLLDWGLPGRDGLRVLQALRARTQAVPVLMITARDAVDDRVRGLDGGADDYLVKPFELAELKARIRSLLRRHEGRASAALAHGSLVLDPARHAATLAGTPVMLTAREYALLLALIERPGVLLSRAQLEERLYGWQAGVESNAVEFLIHSVRRKVGAALIENIRGVGWRLGPAP